MKIQIEVKPIGSKKVELRDKETMIQELLETATEYIESDADVKIKLGA